MRRGFEYPDSRFCVISESDIFGNTKSRKKRKSLIDPAKAVRDFAELSVG